MDNEESYPGLTAFIRADKSSEQTLRGEIPLPSEAKRAYRYLEALHAGRSQTVPFCASRSQGRHCTRPISHQAGQGDLSETRTGRTSGVSCVRRPEFHERGRGHGGASVDRLREIARRSAQRSYAIHSARADGGVSPWSLCSSSLSCPRSSRHAKRPAVPNARTTSSSWAWPTPIMKTRTGYFPLGLHDRRRSREERGLRVIRVRPRAADGMRRVS